MTDFYSQNRCVCSTRSHGPLLCAFCLCFYFKGVKSALRMPNRDLSTKCVTTNQHDHCSLWMLMGFIGYKSGMATGINGKLKMPSKFIRILRITFCYKQLCGRCLVHMTPVVKVVTHCVFALL